MTLVVFLLLAAPQWWDVVRDVAAELASRDVGEWATELQGRPMPTDEGDLMLRFQVLLRAGHLDQLPPVVDALSPFACDEPIRDLTRRGCLDLARRALERASQVSRDTIDEYLRAAGVDEEWLAARAAANDAFFGPWFSYHARRGTAGPLLERLAEGVRGQPADFRVAMRYLNAREEADIAGDPSWLADVVRPRLCTETAEIGGRLARGHPATAVVFLERSLAQPFTEADDRRLKLMLAMAPLGSMEPRFRDATKAELARAWLRIGENDKAQGITEELSARYPDGMPAGLGSLAGQVQAASGARVIEGRIRAEEPERADDPGYWLSRAHYFAGRGEDADARAAFGKALVLAPPSHEKARILGDFARYLANTAGTAEAEALVGRAFAEAEPGSDYAYSVLARMLHYADDRSAFPSPDDERLWRHLAARPVWHDEGRLLERMARRAPQRPEVWRRAAALTAGTDPSRAAMLAEAMVRLGDTRDAIPLLRGAVPRLDHPRRAMDLLFDALLREGDWREAEALASEHGLDLGRVAVAAARAGEQREAMRVWSRRTNLDRLSQEGVNEMIQVAGRPAVAACYAAIRTRDGSFRMPPSLAELVTPAAQAPRRPGG